METSVEGRDQLEAEQRLDAREHHTGLLMRGLSALLQRLGLALG
jgi:hypothetical protein